MASVNISVEFLKSKAYGEAFSFNVGVSCFDICESFASKGYRSTVLYQICTEAVFASICLDDYGLHVVLIC